MGDLSVMLVTLLAVLGFAGLCQQASAEGKQSGGNSGCIKVWF